MNIRNLMADGAVYKDNVQSYSTDEPAIDLTATSFFMYAWRIAGAPKRNAHSREAIAKRKCVAYQSHPLVRAIVEASTRLLAPILLMASER
jgi:hypothetical protein